MTASERGWVRPRLPLGAANHCISVSNHTVSEPRAFSDAWYAAQFVVRYVFRFFLSFSIRSSCHRSVSPCAKRTCLSTHDQALTGRNRMVVQRQ